MNLSLRRSQRGVSLIELTLSLAIIAIILVIATRYFARANLSQQVSNATDQVMGVRAATNSYLADSAGTKTAPTLTVAQLITSGYLPKGYGGTDAGGAGANPWNGNITVGLGTDKRTYVITTTAVPAAACESLTQKLDANANEKLGDKIDGTKCTSDGTVTATFTR